jgi:hypothetical protein
VREDGRIVGGEGQQEKIYNGEEYITMKMDQTTSCNRMNWFIRCAKILHTLY